MENKLKEIIASVLEVDMSDVNEDSSPDTIGSWDSLRQMGIILAVEEQYGVEFDDEEIIYLNSYKKLLESIQNKLNR